MRWRSRSRAPVRTDAGATKVTGPAPLPTFIVIGAQKSATRWLRTNLIKHPEVFTAPRELRFFSAADRYESLGIDWYRAQFEGWAGERVVGEVTPSYMMFRLQPAEIAGRIASVVPDVRLVAILRDPVERAYSAMLHHIEQGRLPADSDLLELARRTQPEDDELDLISGGWYAASLRPYADLFGERLLVVLHDDIRTEPDVVYRQVLAHVGAAPDYVPDGLDRVRFSNRKNAPSESAPKTAGLTPEARRALFAYFRDDVGALEQMLGRDLSAWRPAT